MQMTTVQTRKRRRHCGMEIGLDDETNQGIPRMGTDTAFPPMSSSPVYNNLVLLVVFSLLQLSDLKNCRAVCTLWSDIGIQVLKFRKDVKVVFKLLPQLEGQEQNHHLRRIKEFATAMSSRPYNPFSNYEFHNLSFRNPAVKTFFKLCGSSVKSLCIFIDHQYHSSNGMFDVKTFSKLLTELTPNLETLDLQRIPKRVLESNSLILSDCRSPKELSLPKLRVLRLPSLYDCEYYKADKLGGIFDQILRAAVNLQEIENRILFEFWDDDEFSMLYLKQFVRALTDSGRITGLTTLRFKYIDGPLLLQLCSIATKLGMALIEFQADLIVEEPPYLWSMERFLRTQSNCLQVLVIDTVYHFGMRLEEINFPKMNCLTSLRLTIPYDGCVVTFIQNDDLSEVFPVLSFLHLKLSKLKYFIKTSPTSKSVPTVKTLSIELSQSETSDISTLGSLFPNIETLKFKDATKSELLTMWVTWPKLVNLELNLIAYDTNQYGWDEAFATYPKGIKEMLPELNLNRENPEAIRQSLFPSILEMKQLRRLKIVSSIYRRNWLGRTTDKIDLLSDATGIFVFSNMKNLKQLSIKNTQISAQCEQHIRTALPGISLENSRLNIAC